MWFATQEQQRGMTGDGYSDFVVEGQPSAAFEMLLCNENLDMSLDLIADRKRESFVQRHVSLENRPPMVRKRLALNARAPASAKELKHSSRADQATVVTRATT